MPRNCLSAEEILDQVTCLVERLIDLVGRCSVLPRRDHGGFSGTRQRLENTLELARSSAETATASISPARATSISDPVGAATRLPAGIARRGIVTETGVGRA